MSLLSRLLQKRPGRPAATADPPESRAEPSPAEAAMSEGNGHFRAGNMEQAREAFKRALDLDPANAQAFYMLSAVALNDGEIASAIGLAQRAIALQPSNADFHLSLASVYSSHGRLADAIRSYQEAIRLKPSIPEWHLELAAALTEAGRLTEAVSAYRARLTAGPPDARAYFDLGNALQKHFSLAQAEQAFAQAAALAPEAGGIHVNLAMARRDQGRPVDAEEPARKAIEVAPDMPQGWFILASTLARQARHVEAVEHFRRAVALMPDYEAAWSGALASMNYSEHWKPREIFEAHREWGRRLGNAAAPRDAVLQTPGRRIRVGYLSPDYWQHPVAHFIEPVLRHHDRGRFEVFCYHTGKRLDFVTARLQQLAEHWRGLGQASDDELESALRHDQLDILVELSGHTDGHRLAVLARRVAPVQISYLGYPNTTGLPAMDYRITDARADPPGTSDEFHVEKLLRLPETFLCYSPPEAGSTAHTPPLRRKGHVTFGSFNNFTKISPVCVDLWAKVLTAVPGSKLLIKTHGLQDAGLRTLLLDRFGAAGIGSERLTIAAPTPDHRAHMDAYAEVDIALDTFPYHGTTTTFDALWMGVPVVTLSGDRHAARVGASILGALDLSDLIAHSGPQYVAAAARLASDPSRLDELGRVLRSRLAGSPLMDGQRFTSQLEQAYAEVHTSSAGDGSPKG